MIFEILIRRKIIDVIKTRIDAKKVKTTNELIGNISGCFICIKKEPINNVNTDTNIFTKNDILTCKTLSKYFILS
jgi:hypothetical protein